MDGNDLPPIFTIRCGRRRIRTWPANLLNGPILDARLPARNRTEAKQLEAIDLETTSTEAGASVGASTRRRGHSVPTIPRTRELGRLVAQASGVPRPCFRWQSPRSARASGFSGRIGGADMDRHGYVALAIGVVQILGLGIGLTGLVFYNSRQGYDEGARRR